MYASAQRVRTRPVRSDVIPRIGINAFRYSHHELQPPIDWNAPDVSQIAQETPGLLVAQLIQVPVGGNDVLSFLDVAAIDGTEEETIEAVLDRLGISILGGSATAEETLHGVAIRFQDLYPHRAPQGSSIAEFEALRARLLDVLRAPARHSPAPDPIRVRVSEGSDGFQVDLEDSSSMRVQRQGGLRGRIRIDYAVAADFRALHGPILMHLVAALTGLDRDQLLGLGGVQFVRADTGAVIYQWPSNANPPL